MEQRALVKRYAQFTAALSVAGIAFSIFLIIIGNNGGWGLLVLIACILIVTYYFTQKGKGDQP
ncbi:hypothetical protein [Streptomyces sp. NPDC055886]